MLKRQRLSIESQLEKNYINNESRSSQLYQWLYEPGKNENTNEVVRSLDTCQSGN